MDIVEIISWVLTAISLLTTIISYIMVCKKGKLAGLIEITKQVPSLVAQAEVMFGAGNGSAKKQWVLTQLQIMCLRAKVTVSDSELSAEIDNVVDCATPVNHVSSDSDDQPDSDSEQDVAVTKSDVATIPQVNNDAEVWG